MYLKEVEIKKFRNINEAVFIFSPGITLISGDNAQGKTNLIEALYCLLKGRSFRTSFERECQPFHTDPHGTDPITLISASLMKDDVSHAVKYVLAGDEKRIYYDEKVISRLGDYWIYHPVVIFTPDDLSIIKGSPAERRRFLDMLGSQVWKPYINNLQRCNSVLKYRNSILRGIWEGKNREPDLDPWDTELSLVGSELYVRRWELVSNLVKHAEAIIQNLFPEKQNISLIYDNFLDTKEPLNLDDARQTYLDILTARREVDIDRGVTTTGPQRDDLNILLNDMDSRAFASQGQQRSLMIALRLAESALYTDAFAEPPIMLLDDILSELDTYHREHLLELFLSHTQVFLTISSPDLLTFKSKDVIQRVGVHNGKFDIKNELY